jgi:hypothetical protein
MNKLNDYKKTDFGYELDDDEAQLLQLMDEGHFTSVDKLETRKAEQQKTAKDISDALMSKKKKGLGSRIHQRFGTANSVELELPTRSSPRQALNF